MPWPRPVAGLRGYAAALRSFLWCLFVVGASGNAGEPLVTHGGLAALAATQAESTTLVVQDPSGARWASDPAAAERQSVPASTFKIASTLAALEAGLVEDASTVLPWDGIRRNREEINSDLSLREAFHRSALPHFQALVRRLGPEALAAFLLRVGYGNAQSNEGVEFWLRGPLAISPLEQIAFLEALRAQGLAASPKAQATLWALMEKPPLGDRPWRGKTGWSRPPGGPDVGWFVGALEGSRGPCFVAVRLETDTPNPETFLPRREALAQDALNAFPACRTPAPGKIPG